ncbi:hypothetical protein SynROS8604_01872 [Synechococcus sp. ROS8604]|nr:hypothetical protein SynROS8604_01872 [Synechococcus sp. ROS8604]
MCDIRIRWLMYAARRSYELDRAGSIRQSSHPKSVWNHPALH